MTEVDCKEQFNRVQAKWVTTHMQEVSEANDGGALMEDSCNAQKAGLRCECLAHKGQHVFRALDTPIVPDAGDATRRRPRLWLYVGFVIIF